MVTLALHNRNFNPVFSDLLKVFLGVESFTQDRVISPQWQVKETKTSYIFKTNLPGWKKKNLSASLRDNQLKIQGEQTFAIRESWLKKKRGVQKLYLDETLYLPLNTDVNNIKINKRFDTLIVKVPKQKDKKNYLVIPVEGSTGNTKQKKLFGTLFK